MTTLPDLITRLEQAQGEIADRQLDADIYRFLYNDNPGHLSSDRQRGVYWEDCDGDAPLYTKSVDAALSILPEGWGFMLRRHETAIGMQTCASALRPSNQKGGDIGLFDRWHASTAIAICICALKSRIHSTEEK